MAKTIDIAVVQFSPGQEEAENIAAASKLVREARDKGANIVLLPELFSEPYFCTAQKEAEFARAKEWKKHPAVLSLRKLAEELGVVLPVSIFEKDGPHFYNSVVVIDATGAPLGVYRKSHIPDGPGYQEKFYFRPGNTGFQVWKTSVGNIGVGICWDQWFPESARIMTLKGADILLYPTAIGSEPEAPGMDTSGRWRRTMQGHAASNVIPIAAANRVGAEGDQTYYGSSFIAGVEGDIVAELDREKTGIAMYKFDPHEISSQRAAWGFFRDRRPDLYGVISDVGSA
ncbi:MAG: N-carbamoylputrescine amidase [Pseudomonadota bacterium]